MSQPVILIPDIKKFQSDLLCAIADLNFEKSQKWDYSLFDSPTKLKALAYSLYWIGQTYAPSDNGSYPHRIASELDRLGVEVNKHHLILGLYAAKYKLTPMSQSWFARIRPLVQMSDDTFEAMQSGILEANHFFPDSKFSVDAIVHQDKNKLLTHPVNFQAYLPSPPQIQRLRVHRERPAVQEDRPLLFPEFQPTATLREIFNTRMQAYGTKS